MVLGKGPSEIGNAQGEPEAEFILNLREADISFISQCIMITLTRILWLIVKKFLTF